MEAGLFAGLYSLHATCGKIRASHVGCKIFDLCKKTGDNIIKNSEELSWLSDWTSFLPGLECNSMTLSGQKCTVRRLKPPWGGS
jgi:hypothetical protein